MKKIERKEPKSLLEIRAIKRKLFKELKPWVGMVFIKSAVKWAGV
jgi:hypothetical protein